MLKHFLASIGLTVIALIISYMLYWIWWLNSFANAMSGK